jgi:hypothetical protein
MTGADEEAAGGFELAGAPVEVAGAFVVATGAAVLAGGGDGDGVGYATKREVAAVRWFRTA